MCDLPCNKTFIETLSFNFVFVHICIPSSWLYRSRYGKINAGTATLIYQTVGSLSHEYNGSDDGINIG